MLLLRFILYVAITATVFFAPYYLITKKYSQQYSSGDRVVGAFVFGVSQIILREVASAFPLKLTSLNLLFLNTSLSTGVMPLAGLSHGEMVRQATEARESVVNFLEMALRHRIVLIILGLALFQVSWWAIMAWPIPSYSWDEFSYHLPNVAFMMQSHRITSFPTGFYWPTQDPFTVELVFLWNVIFLDDDIVVNGSQTLLAVATVLPIYGIAMKLGVKLTFRQSLVERAQVVQ